MRFHHRIRTIYAKELIDILRDRRTLLAMIVVPIVMYPLLMLGSIQAVSYQVESLDDEPIRIGVLTEDDGNHLHALIHRDAEILSRMAERQSAESAVDEDDAPKPLDRYEVRARASRESLEEAIRERQLHLGVLIEKGPLIGGLYRRIHVEFLVDSDNVRSFNAMTRLRDVIERTRDRLFEHRLAQVGLPKELAKPYIMNFSDLATPTSLLGQILPLILILLTITGAIYPAIDLTAGERERGTLETLMVCPVPVIDLIVEDNELVIGTHGRGFWVLDNFEPLRQATPNMTAQAVELFNPPLAVRSAPGVTLAWWLRDTPNEAKLEILDSDGELLRTFERASPEEEEEQDESEGGRGGRGGGGPRFSTDPGLNHLTWDLRADPWTDFPGLIFWGARRMGPAVPPGEYTVRLTVDGRTESVPLMVERNPWIPEVTDADLRAQYQFSRQVRDKVTEANQAVIAIRRVKAQLEDRLEQSDDLGLAEAAQSLTSNASAVEENIYQVRNQSNQDPLNFPIKVNNRLANLMSMAERGDGRPGNNMPEIFDILVDELRGYTDRLEEVWATDLAAVNAELVRLEMMPLDPDCDRPEGCVIA